MQLHFSNHKINFKKKRLAPNPYFYWKIIVTLLLVLTLISFGFGYSMFTQTTDDQASTEEEVGRKQPIEKEKIQKVLEYFSVREKKSIEIIGSTVHIVDPSL